MNKILLTLFVLLASATMAFAFGASEQPVEVAGTIDTIEVTEEDEIYEMKIVSEDGEEVWTVRISKSERERLELSEGEEINLTAERAEDGVLEADTLVVGEEEMRVDRAELRKREDGDIRFEEGSDRTQEDD